MYMLESRAVFSSQSLISFAFFPSFARFIASITDCFNVTEIRLLSTTSTFPLKSFAALMAVSVLAESPLLIGI